MRTIETEKHRYFLPSDASDQVVDVLKDLPGSFTEQGELLYEGRNQVRSMTLPLLGPCVVKRFGKPNIFKRLGNLFHGSKCYRAFHNAESMLSRGLATPEPLAGIEDKATRYHYLITKRDDGMALLDYLAAPDGGIDLPAELARYFYTLHAGGILHHDLNNTNIRLSKNDGGLQFSVIDINRMKVYDTMPPFDERMENLFKFSEDDGLYLQVLREYLAITGEYSEDTVAQTLAKKQKYDHDYKSRKRILRKLKGWFNLNR